jgi:hypothetical protein
MMIALFNNLPELIGLTAWTGLTFWTGRRFERWLSHHHLFRRS